MLSRFVVFVVFNHQKALKSVQIISKHALDIKLELSQLRILIRIFVLSSFGFFFESINSIGTSINETGMGSVGGGGQVKDPISGEIIDLGANEHVGRERASTTAVATNGQVFIA